VCVCVCVCCEHYFFAVVMLLQLFCNNVLIVIIMLIVIINKQVNKFDSITTDFLDLDKAYRGHVEAEVSSFQVCIRCCMSLCLFANVNSDYFLFIVTFYIHYYEL